VNRIYAPWRVAYLMQDHKPGPDCLFCAIGAAVDDRDNLVLERAGHWYLIINRFPYTTGHLMVVCNRHVESFSDLNDDERAEFPRLLARGERAVQEAYRPDGINVGANLGRSAGAGIVGHLHIHVVPRWHGDTNFMSAVADTRVVSEDLAETYERIRAALERI